MGVWIKKRNHVSLDSKKYQYHQFWICDIFADLSGMIFGIGLGKLLGKQCEHPGCYSPVRF